MAAAAALPPGLAALLPPPPPPTFDVHAHGVPASVAVPASAAAADGHHHAHPGAGGGGAVDEYEGLSFRQHMAAGAAAGIAEHVAMFPVDTVKTRMQALGHPGQALRGAGVRRALRAVLRREGVRGLYGGVGAVALGAGPAHALYFATYEACKDALGGNEEGHQVVATATAGAAATVASDLLMTPADVVKQRLQVAASPYASVADCVASMLRHEGPAAFYRSLRTTLVMNVPFTAVHFAAYESAKIALGGGRGGGNDGSPEPPLAVQLAAGGVAGGAAAAITTPLDVVKTRLQLEGVGSAARYGGGAVFPTLARIAREEGAIALTAGWAPRVLFHVPAAAVCWGTYETCKRLFRGD